MLKLKSNLDSRSNYIFSESKTKVSTVDKTQIVGRSKTILFLYRKLKLGHMD